MMLANKRIHGLLVLVLVLVYSSAQGAETTRWTLKAAEWSRPRSASAVVDMPPVASAVRAWHRAARNEARTRLQLVHPSGEEGGLWAAELRDWLVALGVAPSAIELVPGGLPSDRLELRVATISH